MKIYRTEAKALARVMALRKVGIWPAVKKVGDVWVLSYNPDVWQ